MKPYWWLAASGASLIVLPVGRFLHGVGTIAFVVGGIALVMVFAFGDDDE